MRLVRWVALIGAAAAPLIGCLSSEVSNAPTPDGATNNGGATGQGGAAGRGTCDPSTQFNSQTCNTCFGDACGTEAQACQGVAACGAIFTCMQGCASGDSACEMKCFADNADGQQAAFTYLGCAYATCHDDCFCPGSCIFGTAAACNTCVTGKCGTQCNGCDKSPDCMGMMMCFQYMGGYDMAQTEAQACLDSCAQLFASGVTPFNELSTCSDTNCTTDCQ